MAEPVIEFNNVSFSIGNVSILEDVCMSVKKGDFLAVLGPNGGGKSTLIKLMLGLYKPVKGRVKILGRPAGESGGQIGYLPQHTHVSASFPITVAEAVRMGTVQPGIGGITGLIGKSDAEKKALHALERVQLADFAHRRLSGLSGGQKQRVFIARALVSRPQLLLLDEPTASVDPASRNSLFSLLAELNRDMTVVMVSHDVSSLATGVQSVACVNRRLHFHAAPEITGEMYQLSYGSDDGCCPVELVTHGDLPHRVLARHADEEDGQ